MNVDLAQEEPGGGTSGTLPEWCRVYEGVLDSEVEAVQQVAPPTPCPLPRGARDIGQLFLERCLAIAHRWCVPLK